MCTLLIENEAMVKEYHISEKCLRLCACAESTLSDVCDRISDGSVTPRELSLIEKKKNHVLKLIGAAIKDEYPIVDVHKLQMIYQTC